MWALRKPKQSQSEKEQLALATPFEHSSSLEIAYQLSEQLIQILNTETSRNGEIRRLKNWITKVKASM